jgi:hypothetical protein
MVVTGLQSVYVPGKLIVKGNATATAANVLAHETMFRLSIAGNLIGAVIFICLAVALYRLFREVDRTQALLLVGLVLVSAAVGFVNELSNLAALILFRGSDFLTVFNKDQLDALGMLFVRLHGQGNIIGRSSGPVARPFESGVPSRFRVLGGWLIVNGVVWVVIASRACSHRKTTAGPRLAQPVMFGEMAIARVAGD